MTNFEKWMSYTSGLSSPQNYLEWSYRFMIAAALERRVWFGSDNMMLFPNTYTILVGKAGLGKGISINPAMELLRFHKRKDINVASTNGKLTEQQKIVVAKAEEANLEMASEEGTKKDKHAEHLDAPLFPYAPDATTFEKLVWHFSKSLRRTNYTYVNGDGEKKLGIIGHCSMNFTLLELASLLRKRTDDTVNFLLGIYDCPLDYVYTTITRQSDRVRRGCLNMLAGTTPEFLETVFDQKLIDQGFSSRAFFIYANKNRKHVFSPEPLTEEQKQYRIDLLAHIKRLAHLYGEVKVAPETMTWLKEWWHEHETNRHLRANTNPKLDPYYARKNIHVIKVAMQEHFSESTEMFMTKEPFERAMAALEKEENTMHIALTFEGDNPLSKLTDKIIRYIEQKKETNLADLVCTFWKDSPNGRKSVEEVLGFLAGAGRIKETEHEDEVTGKVTLKIKAVI